MHITIKFRYRDNPRFEHEAMAFVGEPNFANADFEDEEIFYYFMDAQELIRAACVDVDTGLDFYITEVHF